MTVNDLAWRKSSYSADTNCVEVGWRKSSYSADQTDCVEVAHPAAGSVAVRDSKNPAGGQLNLPRGTWLTFLRNH
jgi:hypothetical protein